MIAVAIILFTLIAFLNYGVAAGSVILERMREDKADDDKAVSVKDKMAGHQDEGKSERVEETTG